MKTLFRNIILSLLLIISSANFSYSQVLGDKRIPISAVSVTDSFKVDITTTGASESFTFPF